MKGSHVANAAILFRLLPLRLYFPHSHQCPKSGPGRGTLQSFAWRSLNALTITETELKVIAALAMIGLSSRPKNG
jgi:hypothetical protein